MDTSVKEYHQSLGDIINKKKERLECHFFSLVCRSGAAYYSNGNYYWSDGTPFTKQQRQVYKLGEYARV